MVPQEVEAKKVIEPNLFLEIGPLLAKSATNYT